MLAKKIAILILLFLSLTSIGQEISGTIKNTEGKPIPYATIYIDELQTGTSANQNGIYNLRVAPGNYSFSFRALGYGPVVKNVSVGSENLVLNIELPFQSYILAGVTVRADDEDPAYAIMRKAIARAPGFVNQTASYTSEVYIKGSIKASRLPRVIAKRIEVNGEKPKEGETYVNESLNKIKFTAPDTYKQEVISVNNTFPMGDKDVPVIGLISGSIYESQDDFYISPFAPNAFAHYKFKYEGLLQDGAWFIDKIKVLPRRKSKLLMEGYLYIVEDLWCIYSYDVKLNPLYTELEIKQYYAPIKGNNYLPVSLFVKGKLSAMGVKADATYTTTIKYQDVVINPLFSQNKIKQAIVYTKDIPDDTTPQNPKVVEIDKKLDELYKHDELNNREMAEMQKLMAKKSAILKADAQEDPLQILSSYQQVVRKDALKRDSLYWDSVRPVPASKDEKISYKKVEENLAKEAAKPFYKKFLRTLMFGNYEWERSKKFHAFYPGILALRNVTYHPVDGFMINQSFKLRYQFKNHNVLRAKGMLGYAFDRKSLFGQGQFSYWYLPNRHGFAEINYGYLSSDYNPYSDKLAAINSLYNLLLKENYIKKYHRTFVSGKTSFELINGLNFNSNFLVQSADTLNNVSNFSILYPNKKYESNIPINTNIQAKHLNPEKKLGVGIGLSYTPRQKYTVDGNGRKSSKGSNWPTFSAGIITAIPVNANFEKSVLLGLGVSQKIDIYTISSLSYRINTGTFINNSRMHFSGFKHFTVTNEPFSTRSFDNSFHLLSAYEYSTQYHYVESHVKYTNQFILLKRFPFISNQLWDENIYGNILYVKNHKPYYEMGYTVSKIMFAGEAGIFAAMKGSEFYGVMLKGRFRF